MADYPRLRFTFRCDHVHVMNFIFIVFCIVVSQHPGFQDNKSLVHHQNGSGSTIDKAMSAALNAISVQETQHKSGRKERADLADVNDVNKETQHRTL